MANTLLKNISLLTGGTVLGQGLVVLASPVLTRLYSPADFGILGVYTSLVAVLAVAASLRYELAIPLPRDDDRAAGLLTLSVSLVALNSLLLWGAVVMVSESALDSMGFAPLRPYLWTLPLCLLGGGVYQALNYWGVRQKAFGTIARSKLNQNLGMLAIQGGSGLLGLGPIGLVVGDMVGRAAGCGNLIQRLHVSNVLVRGLSNIGLSASAYRKFPLIMLWAALLNIVALQAPLVVLPYYFGLAATGLYFLAYRVLNLPISMLSNSVSQVFFAEIARSPDKEHMKAVTRDVTRMMTAAGFPIYIGLAVVGPQAFGLAFGQRWTEVGLYARWLAPAVFLRLIASTLSTLLTVGNRFGESFLFTLIELLAVLLSIGVGVRHQSLMSFVVVSGITSLALTIAAIWRFARVADLNLFDLLVDALVPVLALNLPVVGMLYLGAHYLPGPISVALWLVSVAMVLLISFNRIARRTRFAD